MANRAMSPEDDARAQELALRAAMLTRDMEAVESIHAEKAAERARCWREANELGMSYARLGKAAGVNPSQVDKALRRNPEAA